MKRELVSLLNKLDTEDFENMLLDLYEFYYNFIALRYKDYVDAPHIRELADMLMSLYLNDNSKHLCISVPPRHSKSSIVTLAFPLWLIFHDPDLKILIVNAHLFVQSLHEPNSLLCVKFPSSLAGIKFE